MVISIGGSIQVAEYAFPSTQELADNAVTALANRNAVLLRNHGLVVTGNNMDRAVNNCELSERIAHVFLISHSLGRALELPEEIVQTEREIYSMQQQFNVDRHD